MEVKKCIINIDNVIYCNGKIRYQKVIIEEEK